MYKRNKFLLLIFINLMLTCFSMAQQLMKDQDLVTLKNGSQYLGYIVEQKPGVEIKMYRPTQNDTIVIHMEDIDKLTKILVKAYSEKKIKKNDSIISAGRYNNKKNIYQISFYNLFKQYNDVLSDDAYNSPVSLMGGSLAYYRNFNNRYMPGFSVSLNGAPYKDDNSGDYDTTYSAYSNQSQSRKMLLTTMIENRIRFGKVAQNKRLTTLVSLNIGYVFDFTDSYQLSFNQTSLTRTQYTYETKNNFIIQSTFCLKINPDNNSGFILEPGIAYYNPITTVTFYESRFSKFINDYPIFETTTNAKPLGYTRDFPWMFTFRLSYFF